MIEVKNHKKWDGEYCQECGGEEHMAWSITDSKWEEVMGKTENNICLNCFLEKCYYKDITLILKDIYFFAIGSENNTWITLVDKTEDKLGNLVDIRPYNYQESKKKGEKK